LTAKDDNNKAYGCKSTTLEVIGLLLPILTVPHLLASHELVLHVDNIASVYGWQNRAVKKDSSASILIRALHVISCFLGCIVHVVHLPRMSTPNARLANRLSRQNTTTTMDERRILSAIQPALPAALTRWLAKPCVDWDLPRVLLRDVQDKMRRELR